MNEPPLDELLPQGHQDMLNAYHEYMAQASDIGNQITESDMKTLYLPLKKKWYEMIENGIKTEEYREIKPAKFEREVSIGIDRQPIYKTRCVIEPNCFYEQALNEKNFIKRLKRLGMIE